VSRSFLTYVRGNTAAIDVEKRSRALVASHWNSRGWTFQEYFFSPRRIIFHNDAVNWDCHCTSWHGNLTGRGESKCKKNINENAIGLGIDRWPNLYRYIRLVCLYNIRDLTYPEDALDAFEGIISLSSGVFKGGFICGLPQLFFDASLLWQPYNPGLQRRQPVSHTRGEAVLPSWSWVGWKGNINSESWLAHCNYIAEDWSKDWEPSHTINTVKWYHSLSRSGPRQRIKQFIPTKQSKSPLSGYMKRWYATTYSHPAAPGKQFLYPVPILDRSTGRNPSARSKFIHGQTRHAQLKITAIKDAISGCGHVCPMACLSGSRSRDAGYIRLNETSSNATSLMNQSCELIELSRGTINNLKCPHFEPYQVNEHMVHVMWIEWEDDIAYRKAIGHVAPRVWDHDSTEIEITIG
jgi:hypothetical protein